MYIENQTACLYSISFGRYFLFRSISIFVILWTFCETDDDLQEPKTVDSRRLYQFIYCCITATCGLSFSLSFALSLQHQCSSLCLYILYGSVPRHNSSVYYIYCNQIDKYDEKRHGSNKTNCYAASKTIGFSAFIKSRARSLSSLRKSTASHLFFQYNLGRELCILSAKQKNKKKNKIAG